MLAFSALHVFLMTMIILLVAVERVHSKVNPAEGSFGGGEEDGMERERDRVTRAIRRPGIYGSRVAAGLGW